mmetsp:Transcript_34162/g.68985  ORF Transcript_34162/g.68985 Transcript_34162/m.68985 type:complete len:238 (-) Transcript_34162:152-865(-)
MREARAALRAEGPFRWAGPVAPPSHAWGFALLRPAWLQEVHTDRSLTMRIVAKGYRSRTRPRRSRLLLCAREGQGYTWEEAGRYNEEVRIYVPLDQGEKASDIDFELAERVLRVGVKGRVPAVDGELWRSVELEDIDWMIDQHEGKRSIVVTLTKVNVREGWRHLLKKDAPPDELLGPEEVLSNEMDLSVLGQLDRVQALLQQKRLDEARELMNIMTADIREAEAMDQDGADVSTQS